MRQKLIATLQSKELQNIDAVFMLSLTEKLLLTEELHRRGIRVYWIEHDRIGRWLTKNPWLKTIKRLSTLATTICVSQLSRNMYLKLGFLPERVTAIPNGIDLQRLAGTNVSTKHHDAPMTNPRTLHIGCIARLSSEKGIDLLIKAVGPRKEISLTIVGAGPEEQHLRTMINTFTNINIIQHVECLGEFYRTLDIFILPSREHDPFGLVAAEAMLCGVPTVVTDACGIAGYIRDTEEALIVPAGSVAPLGHAIMLLRHATTRHAMAIRGKEAAMKAFSLQAMIDGYESLLRASQA
jgi:glycosyltransferase involved in cell wall biosynthesis